MNVSLNDRVAKAIREAYGNAEPRSKAHVDANPWEALPPERKHKWLEMAKAANRVLVYASYISQRKD